MVTIIYKSSPVAPIVKKIAATNPKEIKVLYEFGELPTKVGTLLRWDSKAELKADKTLNSSQAVTLSRNKRDSRLVLGELAPTTWVKSSEKITFPCIVRPRRHYAAKGFNVVKDKPSFMKAISKYGVGKWYASPLINKSAEYRVFVFQGHAIKVVRRYCDDPKQVAWNIAVGGKNMRVKPSSWPIDVIKAAIKGTTALKLDYAAVDVIVAPDGAPLVLEANTAPGLARKETIARLGKLLVWADKNEAPKPVNFSGTKWQDYIHPSIKGLD